MRHFPPRRPPAPGPRRVHQAPGRLRLMVLRGVLWHRRSDSRSRSPAHQDVTRVSGRCFGDDPFYHAPQANLTTAAGLGASALALRAPSDAPSVQHRTQCLSPQTAGGAQPSAALGARFTRIWNAIDNSRAPSVQQRHETPDGVVDHLLGCMPDLARLASG